jgi:hypothetical protein
MAELGYRPAAPSDGLGNITVPTQELDLNAECRKYAERWREEEDEGTFHAGSLDGRSLESGVWTMEAFRLMCGGQFWDNGDERGPKLVPALLRKAAEEYESTFSD